MSLTYFGFSTVLLAFLLILICAAALWLVLDSCALWRQFRDQRAMMQSSKRRTFFDRAQRLPMASDRDRVARSGPRVIVFKEEDDADSRPTRSTRTRFRLSDR